MADSNLRRLEQLYRTGGRPEDEVRWLTAAVRAGELSEDALRVGAYLGNEASKRVLGLTGEALSWVEPLLRGRVLPYPAAGGTWVEEVCQATFERVGRNLESIVGALRAGGFEFSEPNPIEPSTAAEEEALRELEKRIEAHVPLTLRCFYRVVGGIALMGANCNWAVSTECEMDDRDCFYADPLVVSPPSILVQCLPADRSRHTSVSEVGFSPDPLGKASVSGGGPYEVPVGKQPIIDGLINQVDGTLHPAGFPRRETFLEHIRRAMRWAGFPGFEEDPDLMPPELSELVARLEPV